MSFLTKDGLILFWNHVKNLVSTKLDSVFSTDYSGMYLAVSTSGAVVPTAIAEMTDEQIDSIVDNACNMSIIQGESTKF